MLASHFPKREVKRIKENKLLNKLKDHTTMIVNEIKNPVSSATTVSYFKHDVRSLNNSRLSELVEDEGVKGIGLYWCVIEFLCGSPGGRCSLKALNNLIRRLKVRKKFLLHILEDYGLFVIENDQVSCTKVDDIIQAYDATVSKSQKKKGQSTSSLLASYCDSTSSLDASYCDSTSSKTQVNEIETQYNHLSEVLPVEDKVLKNNKLQENDTEKTANLPLININKEEEDKIKENKRGCITQKKTSAPAEDKKGGGRKEEKEKKESLSFSEKKHSGCELSIDGISYALLSTRQALAPYRSEFLNPKTSEWNYHGMLIPAHSPPRQVMTRCEALICTCGDDTARLQTAA